MLKPAEMYWYLQISIILNDVSIVAGVVRACLAAGRLHILQRESIKCDMSECKYYVKYSFSKATNKKKISLQERTAYQ